jgi:hypothetical protein
MANHVVVNAIVVMLYKSSISRLTYSRLPSNVANQRRELQQNTVLVPAATYQLAGSMYLATSVKEKRN